MACHAKSRTRIHLRLPNRKALAGQADDYMWTGRDLNSQPPQCECGALPIMLPARKPSALGGT